MEVLTTRTESARIDEGLAALIDPLDVDVFVRDYLGKKPVLIRGAASRFEECFTWDLLNEVLAAGWFDVHRMRVKGTKCLLDAKSFVEPAPQIAPRGKPYRFNAERLSRVLADEGTLVIDCFDYYHAPLRRLVGLLEEKLRSVTQINLYMNQVNVNAQSILHWDDHEVFVMQAEGRKHWSVFPSTTPYPVEYLTDPPEPAPGSECWSGSLTKGDLLYLPRGWWHKVRAQEGPSVHLSFSTRLPWGGTLLHSLVRELVSATASIRRDLPLSESEDEREKWLSEFQAAVMTAVEDPDLLRRLVAREAVVPQRRPAFSFSSEQGAGSAHAGDDSQATPPPVMG